MIVRGFRFHTTIRVRWMECDGQGIVYNGSYMDYLEVAQSEYYRNLGFSIYKLADTGYFDTAVVKVTMEFKAPSRVEDMLDLYMRASRFGNTSLTLEMEVRSPGENRLLATTEAIYVGYDAATGETKRVPDEIRRIVNHFETTGEVLPLDGFPALAAAASN